MKKFTKLKTFVLVGGSFAVMSFSLTNTVSAQVLLEQDFTGGTALGWTATDVSGSGANWVFDNPSGWDFSGGAAAFDDDFAIFDSDYWCSFGEEATLESPEFDASVVGTYTLEFDNDFRVFSGDETAQAEVWDGTSWVAVLTMGPDSEGPNHKSVDISDELDGASNAKVRFHYFDGNCDWYWAVDNVVVTYDSPLPISLASISANNKENYNTVTWTTAKEDVGDHFSLERSSDGKSFASVYAVQARGVAGTYSYIDQSPLQGTNYYRLKCIDLDGTYRYSKVVSAVSTKQGMFHIEATPNPVQNMLTVRTSGSLGAHPVISLTDAMGRNLATFSVSESSTNISMGSYPPGLYLLRFQDDKNSEVLKITRK